MKHIITLAVILSIPSAFGWTCKINNHLPYTIKPVIKMWGLSSASRTGNEIPSGNSDLVREEGQYAQFCPTQITFVTDKATYTHTIKYPRGWVFKNVSDMEKCPNFSFTIGFDKAGNIVINQY